MLLMHRHGHTPVGGVTTAASPAIALCYQVDEAACCSYLLRSDFGNMNSAQVAVELTKTATYRLAARLGFATSRFLVE